MRGRLDVAVVAASALVVAVAVVLAVLRWGGAPPFGSDNDEYQMLATSLWRDGSTLIAGVEATKYPLGYSIVLGALDAVGLPMATTALLLNAALVVATAVGVLLVSRRLGLLPALAGALVLLASVPLWRAYYVVMPDVATAALTLGAFAWLLRRPDTRRDVVVLSLLAAVAVLLKSLALSLALALGAAMLLRPGQRRWAWAPPATAVAVLGLQALATRGLPPASTGYSATFWLVDPGNASAGRIGVLDLPGRALDNVLAAAAEPGQALLGRALPLWVYALAVVVLLVAAGAALPAWRLPLAVLWASHVGVLALWNFRGERFGLPLVALLAVGVAALVTLLPRRPPVQVVGPVLAALLLAASVPVIRDDARRDERVYRTFNTAVAQLEQWVEDEVGEGEDLVSLDYRELAFRLDRPVLPIPYDRDPQVLLEATAGRGADYLVSLRGLYGRREGIADTVVAAYPQRFVPAYDNGTVQVWRIEEGPQ